MSNKIIKIISGGQTGADRGGLDAAIELGLEHGGACPRGRLAEDGRIPDKYSMLELFSYKYSHRTEQNVLDADLTLIFTFGPPKGGSALTVDYAIRHGKPFLHLDLNKADEYSIEKLIEWLKKNNNGKTILNIAGSRESSNCGIQKRVYSIMIQVLKRSIDGLL